MVCSTCNGPLQLLGENARWCPCCGTLTYRQLVEIPKVIAFIRSLLNPEENGHAVPPHIRDAARRVLGMPTVEGY